MEENVALDSCKQKEFINTLRGIKKRIKKNAPETKPKSQEKKKNLKTGKIKAKRKERGLVYLSHIPHGFYEHEMTQYFKQFGVVTHARVIRSRRTGNSRGFAFVEFKDPAVAEIVTETMNNYLMGKRLIKAKYIPPEEQKRYSRRKRWNALNNPGAEQRLKLKKIFNAEKDKAGELKKARKLLANLNNTKKKLKQLGIDYDFFTPVDIPEELQPQIKQESCDELGNKNEEKTKIMDKSTKNKKEVDKEFVVNKKEQKEKNLKLKKLGVKPIQDFIKIEQEEDVQSDDDDNDSDSSFVFDSDEYEKMIHMSDEYDSNPSSGGETSDAENHNDVNEIINSDNNASSEEPEAHNEKVNIAVSRNLQKVLKSKKSRKATIPTVISKKELSHVPQNVGSKKRNKRNRPQESHENVISPSTPKKRKHEKQDVKKGKRIIKKK